jgi:glycerophosphoryl diester phosphodiesterase
MSILPLIVAHRAGNNFDTFKMAVEAGADIVELDVHMTKDHYLVVQCEPFLKTGGMTTYFGNVTLNQLNKQTIKMHVNPILLLRDVLDWGRKANITLMLDIKNGPVFYPNIHFEIAHLVYDRHMEKNVWVISFDHKCIYDIKHQDELPLKAGILYVARLSHLKKIIQIVGADLIETHNKYLTSETVTEAHNAGVKVCGWSSDDPQMIERLLKLSVDMITTNLPEVAREVLNKKRQ